MMTYDAMNMLFQFGIFLATSLTALVAIIVIVVDRKK
ncbi:putative holin-like toxin [Sporosarcina sp. HYO08]|nr:putative holin-like toxin [Sporosarcina sp. HYO08]